MRITIAYESSWRNSFLNGSNDEPLPKKGRQFVASMTELKKDENYLSRTTTLNTVLGILNRLIGDQRKLYQSRAEFADTPHYFEDLVSSIDFVDTPTCEMDEIAYIRNMKGSTDQNSYTGVIRSSDPVFTSDYSHEFWGVLGLPLDKLLNFVIASTPVVEKIPLDPLSVLAQLETIKKLKPIPCEGLAKEVADTLSAQFPKYKPQNNKGFLLPLAMYCSGLYLQMQRLELAGLDMSSAKSKMGGIPGISNNGFTPKDFMARYTSGSKKLIYGNPYVKETFEKGEGKVKRVLTKASGLLEINLHIQPEKAREIAMMIENAGVSSFYLGKKGLAYVSRIDY